MSRNISLSIRRLAVLASALVAMAACQDESPVQPAAPKVAASGPNAIKLKPQFYFNGIVFTGTQDNAAGELYAMNLDGTNITRLTFDDSTDTRVDLSPDGKTMIWNRREVGNFNVTELFTANLDGSNRKQLTHFGTIAGYARYSPDGSKIVFMMRLPSLAYEIFVMNASGNNVKQLTSMNRRATVPTWSPDGSKISFQADNVAGIESIWTMNADGTNQKLLQSCVYPGCIRPKWSPVANEIAYERLEDGGIHVMDASTALETGYIANPSHDQDAAWTKDGKQLVFSSWRGNLPGNTTSDLYMTAPVRGPVTAPPPVIHLTSFVGANEGMPAVSK
jgi:TolB protein